MSLTCPPQCGVHMFWLCEHVYTVHSVKCTCMIMWTVNEHQVKTLQHSNSFSIAHISLLGEGVGEIQFRSWLIQNSSVCEVTHLKENLKSKSMQTHNKSVQGHISLSCLCLSYFGQKPHYGPSGLTLNWFVPIAPPAWLLTDPLPPSHLKLSCLSFPIFKLTVWAF